MVHTRFFLPPDLEADEETAFVHGMAGFTTLPSHPSAVAEPGTALFNLAEDLVHGMAGFTTLPSHPSAVAKPGTAPSNLEVAPAAGGFTLVGDLVHGMAGFTTLPSQPSPTKP